MAEMVEDSIFWRLRHLSKVRETSNLRARLVSPFLDVACGSGETLYSWKEWEAL